MIFFDIQTIYNNQVKSNLQKIFAYKNIHQIPKLEKVVISSSFGLIGSQNKDYLSQYIEEFRLISGQHPILTKAKKAISNFKTRKGMVLGLMVTLRKKKMYAFLQKFIHLVLPGIKDFAGIHPNMVSINGSFSIGVKRQDVFPEVAYNDLRQIRGFNISISTTSKTKHETLALLENLGFFIIKSQIKNI